MATEAVYQEIGWQQVIDEDGSVFSLQTTVIPVDPVDALTLEKLLLRYLKHIRRSTFSAVHPAVLKNGVELRIIGSRWSLISFLNPIYEGNSVILKICGGILVQPDQQNIGELHFSLEPLKEGFCVAIRLSRFFPLLLGSSSPSRFRFHFYRLTQAAIHLRTTVRFLALLYQELVGISAAVRIEKLSVCKGEPV